jgi:double zinc ribbon protein
MSAFAILGITNDGLNLAVKLLLLFLVAVWAALVFWTYADARRRIEDPMLIGCAAAASLFFPFVGTIVYMIVRPPEYIDDVRERELEIAAASARLQQVEQLTCPYCDFEIEKTFLRCPSCLRRLKEPCSTCGRPLDPRWKICPYCEAEVGQAAPQQRRRAGARRTAPIAAPPPDRPSARASSAPQPTVARTAAQPPPPRPGTAEQPAAARTRPPSA